MSVRQDMIHATKKRMDVAQAGIRAAKSRDEKPVDLENQLHWSMAQVVILRHQNDEMTRKELNAVLDNPESYPTGTPIPGPNKSWILKEAMVASIE